MYCIRRQFNYFIKLYCLKCVGGCGYAGWFYNVFVPIIHSSSSDWVTSADPATKPSACSTPKCMPMVSLSINTVIHLHSFLTVLLFHLPFSRSEMFSAQAVSMWSKRFDKVFYSTMLPPRLELSIFLSQIHHAICNTILSWNIFWWYCVRQRM